MKLKTWLTIAAGLIPFVACAPAKTIKPIDPVGTVIGNYCKNVIEESMGKIVFAETKEERNKFFNDLNECIELPESYEALEDKLVKEGYVFRKNLFGKVTKPIRKVVDSGKEYDVVTYEPLIAKENFFDNPNAFGVYGKIFVNENAVKNLVDEVFERNKLNDANVFPTRINAKFYNSLKGKNDDETRQNLFNNILENYVQHELEHYRNNDQEGMNVSSEIKAYVGSFVKSPSYIVFMDLDFAIYAKDEYYGKTAEKIFDLFEVHGVPKEKIPEMSLQELKKVAEEIYRGLN
jgi:hypothetical protein